MSQAKVDRYKEEKANRKKTMAKEKRRHKLNVALGCLVAAAIVCWAGFSGYRVYENNKPVKTVYTNLDALEEYMTSLTADAEEE
ncbi:MAG: hypothetical protein ACI4AD_09425 [Roseburia sp.]